MEMVKLKEVFKWFEKQMPYAEQNGYRIDLFMDSEGAIKIEVISKRFGCDNPNLYMDWTSDYSEYLSFKADVERKFKECE